MRKLIFLLLISLTVTSQAAQDSWSTAFGQGYAEHILRNNEDRSKALRVMCVISPDSKEAHHIILQQGNKNYSTLDRAQALAFQINEGQKIMPSNTMNWQNGANNWDTFIRDLSYSEKINVFSKGKKIATFNIKPPRYKASREGMAKCTYEADRYRFGTERYYEAEKLFRR